MTPAKVKELRDEFAMAALNGMLSTLSFNLHSEVKLYAKTSYKLADEMLKAREL